MRVLYIIHTPDLDRSAAGPGLQQDRFHSDMGQDLLRGPRSEVFSRTQSRVLNTAADPNFLKDAMCEDLVLTGSHRFSSQKQTLEPARLNNQPVGTEPGLAKTHPRRVQRRCSDGSCGGARQHTRRHKRHASVA